MINMLKMLKLITTKVLKICLTYCFGLLLWWNKIFMMDTVSFQVKRQTIA